MKTLIDFAHARGLEVVPIRYKHQFGYHRRKGFDIIEPKHRIIFASFEPVDYSNGDKWHLRNGNHTEGKDYCGRITEKYLKGLDWSQHPNYLK